MSSCESSTLPASNGDAGEEAGSCPLSFARDPLPDVGRAMEELGSFPLASAQEADHVDVYDGDVLQIQGDLGTDHSHLVGDVAEMHRPHAPDQAEGDSSPIRAPLELQHPKPLIWLGRKEGARLLVTESICGPSENADGSEENAEDAERLDRLRAGVRRWKPGSAQACHARRVDEAGLRLELGLVDSESCNLGIQSLPGNPEFRRGPEWAGDAAFRHPQRRFDHLSLLVGQGGVQGLRVWRPRRNMLEPGLVDRERVALAEDDGPLDHVLQLANIARPTVRLEQIERRFRDAIALLRGI